MSPTEFKLSGTADGGDYDGVDYVASYNLHVKFTPEYPEAAPQVCVCVCVQSPAAQRSPRFRLSLCRSANKETERDTEIETRMRVLSRCLSLSSSLAVLSKLSALHLPRRLDRAHSVSYGPSCRARD
jgi:hypothetical protein